MSNVLVRNSELFTSTRLRRLRCGAFHPPVDVPAVGDALDMLHGLMPEHERTQPRHGAAPVPTAGLGRSEPENHIVDDRRRCVLSGWRIMLHGLASAATAGLRHRRRPKEMRSKPVNDAAPRRARPRPGRTPSRS